MDNKTIKTVDDLNELMTAVRKAQKKYSKYSQDKVDEIFKAVALVADQNAYRLAKDAVSETGIGNVEDKIIKNKYASEFIYSQYKDAKTAGIIEEKGSYMKVAEPLGVLAAVIPTTNPTSTAIFKILLALKTRNAIIFSPHPRAKKSTIEAIKICYKAALKAGAPKNIIGWIDEPSVDTSKLLMKECDCILATGGPGMVISAYSSGKPALGVGPGNAPVVIDSTADLDMAAASIIHSKTFDNGTICASEQNCIVVMKVYEDFKNSLTKYGAYIIPKEDMDKVRKVIMIPAKNNPSVCSVNPSIVGKTAIEIAKVCGIDVPFGTKLLVGEIPAFDPNEGFAKEKLSPVLSLIPAANFKKAVDIAENVAEHGGHGHTAALYVDKKQVKKIEYFGQKLETCRILINMPSAQGAIGGIYTEALPPSLTLGCGSWGGNSIYNNVGIDNLLNIKTIAIRKKKKAKLPVPFEIVEEDDSIKTCAKVASKHHKVGVLPLIVSDEYAKKSEFIVKKFAKEGFEVKLFSILGDDYSVMNAKKMAAEISKFSPTDLILACGYDKDIDFAKLVRLYISDSNADIGILSMPSISKNRRIEEFPTNSSHLMVFPFDRFLSQAATNDIINIKNGDKPFHLMDDSLYVDVICIDGKILDLKDDNLDQQIMFTLNRAVSAFISLNATESTDEDLCTDLFVDYSSLFAYKPDVPITIQSHDEFAGYAYSYTGGTLIEALAFAIASTFDKSVHEVQNIITTKVLKFMASDCAKMGTSNSYEKPIVNEKLNWAGYILWMDVPEMEDKEYELGAKIFINSLEGLNESMNIGNDLASLGISKQDLRKKAHDIALSAFNDQCMMSSPVYPTIDDLTMLIKKL